MHAKYCKILFHDEIVSIVFKNFRIEFEFEFENSLLFQLTCTNVCYKNKKTYKIEG